MKNSILSAAVLAAVASSAGAAMAAMPGVPDKFDETLVYNGTGNQAFQGASWEKGVAMVASDPSIANAGQSAVFLSPSYGGAGLTAVTNKSTIWVLGGQIGETTYHKYALGMGASRAGDTATNEGTLYVKGNNGWNAESTSGMGVDAVLPDSVSDAKAPAIINKGLIEVEGGTAMKANTLDANSARSATILNEGDIVVHGDNSLSYGISLGGKDASKVSVENAGTIKVSGKLGFGMTTSDATTGTFVNTGRIIAENGATAIELGRQEGEFSLELRGDSQIDGKVVVGKKGTAHIHADGITDEFELSAVKLAGLHLTDSNLTFTGDQAEGTTIETLSISGKNTLGVEGDRTLTINTLGEVAAAQNRTVSLNEEKPAQADEITFVFDRFAEGDQKNIVIETNHSGQTTVMYGPEAVDGRSAEEVIRLMAEKSVLGVGTDGKAANGTFVGNGTNVNIVSDAVTGNSRVDGSDITKSTNDLAAMTLVAWRNEVTTLNDRMSTLRTSPAATGVWARYNGGEYEYDARSVKNEFHTIEVGADHNIGNGPWTVGASLAYTKGDGDFQQGETDSDSYSAAFYALWNHQSGSFVDMVMKTGRIESDYDFYNLHGGATDSGKLKQTGFIVGVETGHRFALPMNTFVEPQIQLSYSRLSSVHETTEARTIDLEASDSLIGRVGVMAGITCPNNKGAAYVRVSALRDFRGDIDGTYSSVDGKGAYTLSQELDDDWFEFAIGANYNVTDNFVTFVDVQRSTGAEIELNWRANVGAKLFF